MAIQNRRGAYSNFTPNKMVPGEIAVVQSGDPNASDGKSVYVAFQAGSAKRLATYDDIRDQITQATDEIIDEIEEAVADDVEAAEAAAQSVSASAAQIAQNASDITDLKSNLTNGVKSIINGKVSLIIDEFPGYYSGTGSISAQTSTNKEYYTNKIAVTPGEELIITLDIASSNTMWVAVAEFASDQTFKARFNVDKATVGTTVTKTYTVRSDVYYISITYRTYGEHSIIVTKPWDFYVSTNNSIYEFDKNVNIYNGVAERLHRNILLPSDLEEGAIQDGTGKDKSAASQRVRTKVYLPVNKGQHIKCDLTINVYEYKLSDKSYIRDNGSWTSDYTVQNDCYVRILIYNVNDAYTNAELIDKLQIESFTFNGCLTNTKLVADIAENVAENVIETTGFDTVFEQLNPYILPSTTVKTIAHRGDDIVAPQCTAPAYIAARKRGIEIMENDLWLSEDGEFVMWHDTTLKRLGNLVDINGYAMYTDGTDYYWVDGETVYAYDYENEEYDESVVSLESLTRCVGSDYGVNSKYDVVGLNLNVLKRLDFGAYKGEQFAGTQILTFEEWVLLCKQLGAGCYVDKKLSYTNELIMQAASIVKKYGMGGHTSWLGLSVSQIEYLRTIIPGARCGVLSHPNSTNIVTYASVNNGNFFFNGNATDGMTEEAIQLGLNAGYDVEVWYVDYSTATEEQVLTVLRNAINCGVTGITTDHYRASDAYRYMLD